MTISPFGVIAVVVLGLVLIFGVVDCLRVDQRRADRRYQTRHADPRYANRRPPLPVSAGYPRRSNPLTTIMLVVLLIVLAWLYGPTLLRLIQASIAVHPAHAATAAPTPPTTGTSVVGDPDLTASFIDTVLHNAHSPAQGIGATLVRLSEQDHIKPSFILAIFHHESDYGRYGVAAAQTNNVGNIRCSGWPRCTSDHFRVYASWDAGATDLVRVIDQGYITRGATTVQAILPIYAPVSDGNVPGTYIQAVCADMAAWEQGQANR